MQYQEAPPTNVSATPIFRDITISNFTSIDNQVHTRADMVLTAQGSAGEYICLPESPCTNMVMQDVSASGKTGWCMQIASFHSAGYQCEYASGVMIDVNPPACLKSTEIADPL
jgi:hypothetical protein